jgi:hypothetical protein
MAEFIKETVSELKMMSTADEILQSLLDVLFVPGVRTSSSINRIFGVFVDKISIV